MNLSSYFTLESAITKKVLSLWDSPLQSIAEQVYDKNFATAEQMVSDLELPVANLRNFILATLQSCGAYGALLAETTPHFLKDDIFGVSATHLVNALQTSVTESIKKNIRDAIYKVQQDPTIFDDEVEKETIILIQKSATKERYLKEFVTFADKAEGLIQVVSGLHTSRLSTYGFTVEAEFLGIETYKLAAVLDARTSHFCEHIAHGKVFQVEDAKRKVVEVLNAPTEDAKFLQPWVKSTKANLAILASLTPAELTARGLHIPPFHPYCRTLCLKVDSKLVVSVPAIVQDSNDGIVVPTAYADLTLEKAKEPLTDAFAKYLEIKATQKAIQIWNKVVSTDATQTIANLTNKPLQEVAAGLLENKVSIRAVKDGSVTLKGLVDVDGGTQEFSYNLNPLTRVLKANYLNFKNVADPQLGFAKQMSNIIEVAKGNNLAKIVLPVEGPTSFLMALLDFTFADMAVLQVKLAKRLEALNKAYPLLIKDDYDALLAMVSSSNLESVGLQSIAKYPLQIGNVYIGELLFKGIKGDAVLDMGKEASVAAITSFLANLM